MRGDPGLCAEACNKLCRQHSLRLQQPQRSARPDLPVLRLEHPANSTLPQQTSKYELVDLLTDRERRQHRKLIPYYLAFKATEQAK